MGDITADYIERYIHGLIPRDEFLEILEADAARRNIPIVEATEGYLLYLLAKMAEASSILEIGTAIGYSAIWLARAVPDGGMVYTIERYEEFAEEAIRNIEKAGLSHKVKVLVGEAREILSEMDEEFDLIFNDADKEEYPELLDLMLPLLKDGGLLLTDNALWYGSVAESNKDKLADAVHEYNKRLADDPKMETTIIPVRDGVSIALKKS